VSQKTSFKWWWGWQPEVLEEWLEHQESAGWQLFHVDTAAIRFFFRKGEPRKVRYCVDYQTTISCEYRSIFEDAGWQLKYAGLGWYLWALPYENRRPDIFNDLSSLIERNRKLSNVMTFAVILMIATQLPLLATSIKERSISPLLSLLPFYVVGFGFFGWVLFKLRSANNKIKKNQL